MIGVIADDLTGAAEIGAVGLRHGLQAEVLLAGEPSRDVDLVCLDNDSRSCAPSEAAQCAATAGRMLQHCGAEWIYTKTDSVLRGNVTPELEAIVTQLGLRGVLLMPANPSLGRTVVKGQHFARSQLIHQKEFAEDPKHLRLCPNVLELLDRPLGLPISVGKSGEMLPERGIVVGEAASAGDVRGWAKLQNERWLMAGSAEFFGALLKSGTPIPQSRNSRGKGLWLCGSASEATHKFVAGQAQRGAPVFSPPNELTSAASLDVGEMNSLAEAVAATLQSAPRVVLQVGLPALNDAAIAEMLSLYLVGVAEGVLRRVKVGHVFAEGGATAVALARCMGWSQLKVLAELAPGVVTLSVSGSGSPLVLTIKPGSYAWPQSLFPT